jgi:hypothetical protein
MRVFVTLCAVVASAAAVTACGGSAHTAPSSTSTAAAAQPSSSAAPAASTPPRTTTPRRTTPAAPQVLPIGAPFDTRYVTAKVVAWRPTAPLYEARPQPGERYAALEVKVCAKQAGAVSNAPWSLVGSDSGNYDTVITGGGLIEPQYPSGRTGGQQLAAGECLLGWITYVVPTNAVIVTAKYAAIDNGEPEPVGRWRVTT